jgi:2-ketocyclohexanecarboxyl-CoA hydrolase
MDIAEFTDITYEVDNGLAWVTIDRPERYNSFRARTMDELIRAFKAAWVDSAVGVIALTGAGEKAFCTGGDQKERAEAGDYGPSETGVFEVETFHRLIREVPKPVIAAVNGYAIGGGHVIHLCCDITIAADHAIFGQTGPKVGSFDAVVTDCDPSDQAFVQCRDRTHRGARPDGLRHARPLRAERRSP